MPPYSSFAETYKGRLATSPFPDARRHNRNKTDILEGNGFCGSCRFWQYVSALRRERWFRMTNFGNLAKREILRCVPRRGHGLMMWRAHSCYYSSLVGSNFPKWDAEGTACRVGFLLLKAPYIIISLFELKMKNGFSVNSKQCVWLGCRIVIPWEVWITMVAENEFVTDNLCTAVLYKFIRREIFGICFFL